MFWGCLYSHFQAIGLVPKPFTLRSSAAARKKLSPSWATLTLRGSLSWVRPASQVFDPFKIQKRVLMNVAAKKIRSQAEWITVCLNMFIFTSKSYIKQVFNHLLVVGWINGTCSWSINMVLFNLISSNLSIRSWQPSTFVLLFIVVTISWWPSTNWFILASSPIWKYLCFLIITYTVHIHMISCPSMSSLNSPTLPSSSTTPTSEQPCQLILVSLWIISAI